MQRLRIGFALLGLVLLVPLATLVLRSLDALEREHELRHAAVASRVFEEVERAFSEFLRDEEERPAGDYSPLGNSALAGGPSRSFVLAYFQTDGSGRIESPMRELSAALRAELEESLASSRDREPGRELAKLESGAQAEASEDGVVEAKDGLDQAPGSMRVVQNVKLLTGREIDALAEQKKASKASKRADADGISSYGALEELGRVAKSVRRDEAERRFGAKERSQNYAVSRQSKTSAEALAESEAPALADAMARAPAAVVPSTSLQSSAPPAPPAGRAAIESADDAPRAVAGAAREERSERSSALLNSGASQAVRLAMAPSRLSGEKVGAARLLLYRTAIVDRDVPVRQGMLVDLAALARWTETRVLGDSALGDAIALEFPGWTAAAGEAPPPAGRFVYDHRFDAPLEALSLRLALAPLRDTDNARSIYWLAVLLILASTFGLYALYRLSAVAVHFAERRSNFAASVSHELKTPLTAIRMYAEMLRDGMVGDEAKRDEYYATITSESERLSRLIDNVLEWSKLEKEQRELSLTLAPVEPVLREVARVLRPHAEARGFELVVDIEPDLPSARYDADALQQIVFNLVDNGLKYAAEAECKRIHVSAVRRSEGVEIAVRDFGPGVAPSQLPLVFEAFYRAEDELTRRTKGTGIGLALVRGLAEAMGGRAQARNLEAEGDAQGRGGFEAAIWLQSIDSAA